MRFVKLNGADWKKLESRVLKLSERRQRAGSVAACGAHGPRDAAGGNEQHRKAAPTTTCDSAFLSLARGVGSRCPYSQEVQRKHPIVSCKLNNT
eukprot:6178351-Pleurochrysis_carterae.AAC.2